MWLRHVVASVVGCHIAGDCSDCTDKAILSTSVEVNALHGLINCRHACQHALHRRSRIVENMHVLCSPPLLGALIDCRTRSRGSKCRFSRSSFCSGLRYARSERSGVGLCVARACGRHRRVCCTWQWRPLFASEGAGGRRPLPTPAWRGADKHAGRRHLLADAHAGRSRRSRRVSAPCGAASHCSLQHVRPVLTALA